MGPVVILLLGRYGSYRPSAVANAVVVDGTTIDNVVVMVNVAVIVVVFTARRALRLWHPTLLISLFKITTTLGGRRFYIGGGGRRAAQASTHPAGHTAPHQFARRPFGD